jgi:branched-chain amino acid transport system ATP-binding protein
MAPLLELAGVTQRFGGLVAVDNLDFSIDAGSIVAMIGPNGAGKSTVFNLITGIYAPAAGRISFAGTPIGGKRTSAIAAGGIARTFQNIRLFAFMSALDNVMTGEHARMRAGVLDSLLHTRAQRERSGACANARSSCCASSASNRWPTSTRPTSPTVCSAGSRSRGRSPPSRSCCCSTSPPPG